MDVFEAAGIMAQNALGLLPKIARTCTDSSILVSTGTRCLPPAASCTWPPPTSLLAREAQAARTFYERHARLLVAVPNYLSAGLAGRDRRNMAVLDRLRAFRGGRRCTEVATPVAGDQALAPHPYRGLHAWSEPE